MRVALVADGEVARGKHAALIAEGAGQDERVFHAVVRVVRNALARLYAHQLDRLAVGTDRLHHVERNAGLR